MDLHHEKSKIAQERPALQPPRFSMATLLIVVSGCGVLFGLMTALGPLGGFALLLFVLVLVAHVAGNSLGTRLRGFGSETLEHDLDTDQLRLPPDLRRLSAPASNLSSRGGISRTMLGFTAAGAVLVGTIGSALLMWLVWDKLNIATAIVACVSPAVLGGLIGFAISSFTQTAGGAWREASASYRRESTRR